MKVNDFSENRNKNQRNQRKYVSVSKSTDIMRKYFIAFRRCRLCPRLFELPKFAGRNTVLCFYVCVFFNVFCILSSFLSLAEFSFSAK